MTQRLGSRLTALLLCLCGTAHAEGIHTTYLWHLEQPVYWPAPNASGLRYHTAWDALQAQRAGAKHPQNDLAEIFGKDDRVAIYQGRARDALQGLLHHAEVGAQLTYAGVLIENIASLGAAGQLGYGPGWNQPLRQTRAWLTRGGQPRLDLMQFSFHHGLLPLLDPEVGRVELLLHQRATREAFGAGPGAGLFPAEMAFAEHILPTLVAAGVQWVVVSNAHLSRACADYPFVAGSGGDNTPPPNAAELQNPAQRDYNRVRIDRGVSPASALPFGYLPHFVRYVDPSSGAESRIIAVPAAMGESWKDGYACFGTDQLSGLAPYNKPERPLLVLLAHDGDNAFGGGFSYYMECTPNFVNAAAAQGLVPTTVAQYLADHPPARDDVVHVEPGAWVNADGDFGAPTFLNWNWPLMNQAGQVDIAGGWSDDERGWAIITAATNYVRTASAAAGMPDLGAVLNPERGADAPARAWHFLLGAIDSGYMYYGDALDMELKPVVASNAAVAQAQQVLAATGGADALGPTIFLPQRYPDNPGALNFGPLYRYQKVMGDPDFWVWTFVHDVSGVREAVLRVRVDEDGVNPLSDDANETYAGGPGVGAWRSLPLTRREFPKGNPLNNPNIDTSILPTVIADEYYTQVTGFRNVLLDYYVEATDNRGRSSRSPIQHVVVGEVRGPVVVPPVPDGGAGPDDGGQGGAGPDGPGPGDNPGLDGGGGAGCGCSHAAAPAAPVGSLLLLLGLLVARRRRPPGA